MEWREGKQERKRWRVMEGGEGRKTRKREERYRSGSRGSDRPSPNRL